MVFGGVILNQGSNRMFKGPARGHSNIGFICSKPMREPSTLVTAPRLGPRKFSVSVVSWGQIQIKLSQEQNVYESVTKINPVSRALHKKARAGAAASESAAAPQPLLAIIWG